MTFSTPSKWLRSALGAGPLLAVAVLPGAGIAAVTVRQELSGTAPAEGPARVGAQEPLAEQDAPDDSARQWAALLARDASIAFGRRTAQDARAVLASQDRPANVGAAALLALGASGSVNAQLTLEASATEGTMVERRAAVLALGEWVRKHGSGDALLHELLDSEDELLGECAMLGLVRSDVPACLDRVREIAGGAFSSKGERARALLAYADDPALPCSCASVVLLMQLRFEAAKRFGTVDGQAWSRVLLLKMQEDDALLDEFIFSNASRLGLPGIKDHFLEILLRPGDPMRLRAVVRAMPIELDKLVDAGVWRPVSEAEWVSLVDEAVESGASDLMPATMHMAARMPSVAPTAAAELINRDERFEPLLLEALKSSDPALRARAARGVGTNRLDGFLERLRALERDRSAIVRCATLVARLQIGDLTAKDGIMDTLLDPSEGHQSVQKQRMLDALEAGSGSPIVLEFVRSLSGEADGMVAVELQAILASRGRLLDPEILRESLPRVAPRSPAAQRIIRGLGHMPSSRDLKLLSSMFPVEGAPRTNMVLMHALVKNGHGSIEPLLHAAVWRGPWHRSLLSAAVVKQRFGIQVLMHWITKPPDQASTVDIRRLGFAIGEWGGVEAIDNLRARLGGLAGADRPALQGALLGALTTRTH